MILPETVWLATSMATNIPADITATKTRLPSPKAINPSGFLPPTGIVATALPAGMSITVTSLEPKFVT